MFKITFGIRQRTVCTSDRSVAFLIAQLLAEKGWLAIEITSPNGERVPDWKIS